MLKPMVEVRNEAGILVAEFWDCLRLDPNPVRDLRQHYETHLKAKGKPDLVVDMNGVVFAGSAALGGFLALQRLARQQGGRVVFCKVDENVQEVFRISKLAPMFRARALPLLPRTRKPRRRCHPGPTALCAGPVAANHEHNSDDPLAIFAVRRYRGIVGKPMISGDHPGVRDAG
jgi:anti-anti-sigma factor